MLTLAELAGSTFKLLRVMFDDEPILEAAVDQVVKDASWKMKTLLRTEFLLHGCGSCYLV